ncbi:hypothetical protein [Moorena producens]|uniref:hypothetical protein n=1 Tax=Moorena producens TaxID=1155739 RepID=UPI001054160F|nr:hypothetical protein [Moorena producens]
MFITNIKISQNSQDILIKAAAKKRMSVEDLASEILSDAARSWGGSAVLGRQRGLGEAARSWGGSAVLGVPPMSDCRGSPHERLPWFPP